LASDAVPNCTPLPYRCRWEVCGKIAAKSALFWEARRTENTAFSAISSVYVTAVSNTTPPRLRYCDVTISCGKNGVPREASPALTARVYALPEMPFWTDNTPTPYLHVTAALTVPLPVAILLIEAA
jgi:hypothetical protein